MGSRSMARCSSVPRRSFARKSLSTRPLALTLVPRDPRKRLYTPNIWTSAARLVEYTGVRLRERAVVHSSACVRAEVQTNRASSLLAIHRTQRRSIRLGSFRSREPPGRVLEHRGPAAGEGAETAISGPRPSHSQQPLSITRPSMALAHLAQSAAEPAERLGPFTRSGAGCTKKPARLR